MPQSPTTKQLRILETLALVYQYVIVQMRPKCQRQPRCSTSLIVIISKGLHLCEGNVLHRWTTDVFVKDEHLLYLLAQFGQSTEATRVAPRPFPQNIVIRYPP
eukprot:1115994-Amphidinium_carterae.1